jgi:hypothetical protein
MWRTSFVETLLPSLSGLPYPYPHHGNDTGTETRDEREQYEHVAIIIICVESKQLETPVNSIQHVMMTM